MEDPHVNGVVHPSCAGTNENIQLGVDTSNRSVAPSETTKQSVVDTSKEPVAASKTIKRIRRTGSKPTRCRNCGRIPFEDEWKKFHIRPKTNNGTNSNTNNLWNQGEIKFHDVCTVPKHDWAIGFPCLEGDMPRY